MVSHLAPSTAGFTFTFLLKQLLTFSFYGNGVYFPLDKSDLLIHFPFFLYICLTGMVMDGLPNRKPNKHKLKGADLICGVIGV